MRRLPVFGVQRALGFTPGRLAAAQAAEAALLGAAPAAALGLALGALAVAGPSADLLAQLNEQPPGAVLLAVLAGCLLAITALVTAAATWPAWAPRAARRRRSCAAATSRRYGAAPQRADGLLATGARFATAARGRFAASVATIAVCAGVVTLMLALAALLERLRDDPGTVGKRYQLTVRLEPFMVDSVQAIPASPTPPSATRPTSPNVPAPASRYGSSPTPATTRASSPRRLPRAAACTATVRPRSASASPTRSGCGRARRSPSRRARAPRSASASAASSARSSTVRADRVRAACPAARVGTGPRLDDLRAPASRCRPG